MNYHQYAMLHANNSSCFIKVMPNNISKIPVEFPPTSSRNLFNVLVSRVKRTAPGRAFTATSQRHRFRRMEPSRDSSKSLQSSKPLVPQSGTCRGRAVDFWWEKWTKTGKTNWDTVHQKAWKSKSYHIMKKCKIRANALFS